MRHDEVDNVHIGLTQMSFSGSALFRRTFDEGMALVEETARYLDGPGRADARSLSRKGAILYAGESMRLTTRMMQAASWLLVQRAVNDGDMEADQAASSRYRLGSKEICLGAPSEHGMDLLPQALRDLLARSENLYRRILRLDETLFADGAEPLPRTSGVQAHIDRLEQAFARD
jgi:regulator of CtrA degradation